MLLEKCRKGCRRFSQKGADGPEQLAISSWQLAKVKTGDLTAKDAEGAKVEKKLETRRNGGSGGMEEAEEFGTSIQILHSR